MNGQCGCTCPPEEEGEFGGVFSAGAIYTTISVSGKQNKFGARRLNLCMEDVFQTIDEAQAEGFVIWVT